MVKRAGGDRKGAARWIPKEASPMSDNQERPEREARLEAEVDAARGVVWNQPQHTTKQGGSAACRETGAQRGYWPWTWFRSPWRSQQVTGRRAG